MLSGGSSEIHRATRSVSSGSGAISRTSPSPARSPLARTSPREPSSFTARSSIVPPLFRAVVTMTPVKVEGSPKSRRTPTPSLRPP